jgi:hypothetical protein
MLDCKNRDVPYQTLLKDAFSARTTAGRTEPRAPFPTMPDVVAGLPSLISNSFSERTKNLCLLCQLIEAGVFFFYSFIDCTPSSLP